MAVENFKVTRVMESNLKFGQIVISSAISLLSFLQWNGNISIIQSEKKRNKARYLRLLSLKYLWGFKCGAGNSNCEVQMIVPNNFKESKINNFSKEQ